MKSENTRHKTQLDSQLGKLKDSVSFIVPNVLQEYFLKLQKTCILKVICNSLFYSLVNLIYFAFVVKTGYMKLSSKIVLNFLFG